LKSASLLALIIILLFSCTNQAKKEKKPDNAFYDQAFEYREKGSADSAFFYFNIARDLFLQQKDSISAAKCLVNMSMIAIDKGDNFGAQEMALKAITYFDLSNKAQSVYISSNYNNLGMATHNLRDLKRAIQYFQLAIDFSQDSLTTLVNQNNKATVYKDMKAYKAALKIYRSILRETGDNKIHYARALTNLSFTSWLQDHRYNPVPNYLKALRIRVEEQDLWGQNSSYTHLADYYEQRSLDTAVFYAKRKYELSKVIQSPGEQISALKELIKLTPAAEAKKYFSIYQQLDDSVQTAMWNDKNQFALIRYETEKHKADALTAQAENEHKKNSLLIQNFILAALIICLAGTFLWYRKRREVLQQEKELEVKNTELKYVKKIHDRVANKVYHLMSEVENTQILDRDMIMDKLEVLYDTSRDISYERQELSTEGTYADQLSEMLQSYSSSDTEVLIVGNDDQFWKDIGARSKTELVIVLQELMTNMRKHSKAQRVVVKFQRDDICINVLYVDNGVGMGQASPKNGLQNTENRMNGIGGRITFESIHEKGLEVTISFPLA
jgi:two-component sensor histidine kinase